MRRAIAAAAASLLAACGASEPALDEPPMYKYSSVESAVAEAGQTLDVFWTAFESGDPALSDFRVSIPLPGTEYVTDYAWVEYLQRGGDGAVRGILSLEEDKIDGLRPGDAVNFIESDIVDWRYEEEGRLRGAYVMRAMLETGPARDADIDNLRARFHDSPVP
ncbi:MAG: DUF2314 domain-containing protein [Pseudomonadota bacterium]